MVTFDPVSQVFHLSNNLISYVFSVDEGNILSHLYFGKRINKYHQERRYPRVGRAFSGNLPGINDDGYSKDAMLQELSGNNTGDYRVPSIVIRAANGSRATDFRYQSYEILAGKPTLKGLPSSYVKDNSEAETLIVTMIDETLQLSLQLTYTIFRDRAVIARSNKLVNLSHQPIHIEKIASAELDFTRQKRDVISLPGAHVAERQIERQEIHQGILTFDSKRGTSSHQMNPFVAIVEKQTNETIGEAVGMLLVYSGNHQFTVEGDQIGQVRVVSGINEYNFDWVLAAGESFQTPEAIIVFAKSGLNEMSDTYHHLLRERVARGKFQYAERPIVINNWEATRFNFNEEKLVNLVKKARPLGIEMFVLDDGWFGHRDEDNSSLGDWRVDLRKLPGGLTGLAKKVHQEQMKFGLWFEPEMISTDSDLYRQHPDFALQIPERQSSPSRHQFVLDFSRPDVVDSIFAQMSKILATGDIDYVKWDMNRSLSEVYSLKTTPEHEGETSHRYVLGLYKLMERLTRKYPDILFEGCSGGGGRFDAGILYYMPQSWTSDNTDPIARQKIQYGTSLVYPISAISAHVSESPNQQTGRESSMQVRGDVAMSGVLGYELDLDKLTDDERAMIRSQIKFYKAHRQLIQYGRFLRLKSPFTSNEVAWEFVSADQTEVLLFTFRNLADARKLPFITKLRGLDPDFVYLDHSNKQGYGGDELMELGLYNDPARKGDFVSLVRYFTKQ